MIYRFSVCGSYHTAPGWKKVEPRAEPLRPGEESFAKFYSGYTRRVCLYLLWFILGTSLWNPNTSLPHFIMICCIVFHRQRVFQKLKVCCNHVLNKSIGAIFPTKCAHFVSYFGNSCNIWNYHQLLRWSVILLL